MSDDKYLCLISSDFNLADATKDNYLLVANDFAKANNNSFDVLVDEIKSSQHDELVDGLIYRFDPDEGLVKKYVQNYLNMAREKGNGDATLAYKERNIRSILNRFGVILYKRPIIKYKQSQEKRVVLSRDEIQAVISYSRPPIKAVVSFLASTGMRVGDIYKLTIGDFMKATDQYHKAEDAQDFIRNAPSGMRGFWKFKPHKTHKNGLECRVCNTPESSNYILAALRERHRILKHNGITLTEEDKLFAPFNKREGYRPKSLENILSQKKKVVKDYNDKKYFKLYNDGEISHSQYKKCVAATPDFSAHKLRRFFSTTARQHILNTDVCLIMEAHTSNQPTDKFYIGVNDELFSDESIIAAYTNELEEFLTFANSSKTFKSLDGVNVEDEVNDLRKDIEEMKQIISKLQDENSRLKEERYSLDKPKDNDGWKMNEIYNI